METGITKNEVITALTRSPHGKLAEYVPIGKRAAKEEPEFLAHLISWDREHGQIRDSKTALPIVSLSVLAFPDDYVDNSLAHLAKLDPRSLVSALRFGKEIKMPDRSRKVRRVVERYLRVREGNCGWFDRVAVQHRKSLKELYALGHVKPDERANKILFGGERPTGSIFEAVAQLKNMTPQEAAGTIMERKIPFLIAIGALGSRAKEPDLVMALMERMTPTELTTNMKMLERLGVKGNPVLMAALSEALGKAAKSKKTTLKATKAAESLGDVGLKKRVQEVQEQQIATAKGIEGNWLVLGDKSGSMQHAIEGARHIAATLAKFVRGQVHLIFFDNMPRYIDATGKTYDDLVTISKGVTASGGTSIGCGLLAAVEKKLDIDGIAIVSDGGENGTPYFQDVYVPFAQAIGKSVPVYLYLMNGEPNVFGPRAAQRGIDVQTFDLRGGVDWYSLPNLVQTMRAQRYGLVEEIMESPLLTLEEVFNGN